MDESRLAVAIRAALTKNGAWLSNPISSEGSGGSCFGCLGHADKKYCLLKIAECGPTVCSSSIGEKIITSITDIEGLTKDIIEISNIYKVHQ